MGSPGPTKSRHNKREQRGPAEKLAGGDPGEGTRSGQAAGGAPARPVAWPPPRPPAGPPARGSRLGVAARPAALPSRPPRFASGRRPGRPAQGLQIPPASPPPAGPRRAPFPGLYQTSSAGDAGTEASAASARRGSAE